MKQFRDMVFHEYHFLNDIAHILYLAVFIIKYTIYFLYIVYKCRTMLLIYNFDLNICKFAAVIGIGLSYIYSVIYACFITMFIPCLNFLHYILVGVIERK